MCGISGIVRFDKRTSEAEVRKMTDTLAHRGPDGEGVWINPAGNVGLGHRRLAVIDLSELGRQPMISEDHRFAITFNGEIYNYVEIRESLQKQGHKFSTLNDTEVLLKLFILKGKDCLNELDGMFAFAIWDNEKKELFCARDRFGEKPFFYQFNNSFFAFASEMKAFWPLGISDELNERMAYNYEFFGYKTNPDNHGETFYKNALSLSSGHFLILRNEKISIHKYYDIDLSVKRTETNFEDVSEELKSLLQNSVKLRLRGQVEVGSSFSGGLDSSIVVTGITDFLKETKQSLNVFSAIFPGFEKNEEKFIKMLIEGKNIIPHFILPDKEKYTAVLDELFRYHEEPFTSPSVLAQYFIYKEARNKNVIVLLDGQGADEVFGGYHSYYDTFFQTLYRTDKNRWYKELQAYHKVNRNNRVNSMVRGGLFKQFIANNFHGILDLKRRKNFEKSIPKERFGFYKSNLREKFEIRNEFKSLTDELHYQTFSFGLPALLRYADRNSMANGVEIRLPFLDHKIVELLFSLPDNYKINQGWTKWILRETYKKDLPEEICWRKEKIGLEPDPANFTGLNYRQALQRFMK